MDRLKTEQFCLDFGHYFLSEIGTRKSSDFSALLYFNFFSKWKATSKLGEDNPGFWKSGFNILTLQQK